MLVVPLEKDSITTADGQTYTVIEYTNLKTSGPAVYCKMAGQTEPILVYFFDVVKIGKTDVEFSKSSKVFNALGNVKRQIDIPQPDDKVTVEEGGEPIDVKTLKLKSKSLGRGLFVQGVDHGYYPVKGIISIDRSLGGGSFDRELFLQIYREYLA